MSETTPFHDLDAYLDLPRLGGLAVAPDGSHLVTTVSRLDPDRTGWVSELWRIDLEDRSTARRLTRSAKGETSATFLPDGSLLFTSARPDPEAARSADRETAPEPKPALWMLPAGGGEARVIGTRPGGITSVAVAAGSGTVVVTSATLPGAADGKDDERRRRSRRDLKVSAILHESYPVRHWDADLGPAQPRLLAGSVPAAAGAATRRPDTVDWNDLTPSPGRALDESCVDVSPDGSTVATTWQVPERGGLRQSLALIDVADGGHRLVLDDEGLEFGAPRFSPDGRKVAVVVQGRTGPGLPPTVALAVYDVALRELTWLARDSGLWFSRPGWTPDGRALIATADQHGTCPVFRIEVANGQVSRLTGDHGAYCDVVVCPDGAWVYALRSAVDSPPVPVRLDPTTADQLPRTLASPAPAAQLPGTLAQVAATAQDGTPLRAWLVLPPAASSGAPTALLVWVHGGPLSSWNSWSWRWNPWLAAARGYAVLLPDPALSTGYGPTMIERGWGRWGGEPYTDVLTLTDAALLRDDLDPARTALMGGSFGGYLANWVAGHTDRFRGIVTHAGLWALDQFGPTTDRYDYWRREVTAEMAATNSPHRYVDEIRTPMLVVHGDRDYRVPIGEGLRLWAELAERGDPSGAIAHKFLYFPDENHWVLSPQHAKVWYETVFAFLDTTVHGRPWVTPDILR